MTEVVLDSSAVLAEFHREPGADVVRASGLGARISAVNFAEVITKLIEEGVTVAEARYMIDTLALTVEAVDQSTANTAGMLHEKTRRTGISLGDRFCLALALELGLPVLTTDRRWAELDIGVDVRLIR